MDTPHRVSDTDRDHTAARLREAVGEGRLTLAEADGRIAAAYAAVDRHDLDVLTADLPVPVSEPVVRSRPPVLPIVLLVLVVVWIASPLPFPWPLVLIGLLVFRGVRRRNPAARA